MSQETATVSNKVEFGNGRYSATMAEFYRDALRLTTLEPKDCEALARNLGADLGRQNLVASIKYGKANAEGRLTLKEVASIKGVVATKAMSLARLMSLANDLSKEAKALGTVDVTFNVTLDTKE